MKLRVATVFTVALMVTACSKSSVELLKEGDPKVCAKSDVTSQIFDIIRQNASAPSNRAGIPNFDDAVKGWADKIKMTIDGVTSTDVDVPNRKITCNGQVHISADGVNGEQTQSVNYQVTTDLSSDKAVVSAQLGSSNIIVSQLMAQVAAPEIEKAEKDRTDTLEKQWTEDHAADIATWKSRIDAQYSNDFSPEDRAKILHAVTLEAATGAANGNDRELLQSRSSAFTGKIDKENICETADAERVWQHCHSPQPAAQNALSEFQWTPEQNAMIAQAEDLNDKCRGGDGDQTEAMCDQRDALMEKMKTQGICWGPEDAIEADKHWMHCS